MMFSQLYKIPQPSQCLMLRSYLLEGHISKGSMCQALHDQQRAANNAGLEHIASTTALTYNIQIYNITHYAA